MILNTLLGWLSALRNARAYADQRPGYVSGYRIDTELADEAEDARQQMLDDLRNAWRGTEAASAPPPLPRAAMSTTPDPNLARAADEAWERRNAELRDALRTG